MLLSLYLHLQTALVARRHTARDERGQATAEYALVLLGAAAVAVVLTVWAGKSGTIGRFLDAVLDKLLGQV